MYNDTSPYACSQWEAVLRLRQQCLLFLGYKDLLLAHEFLPHLSSSTNPQQQMSCDRAWLSLRIIPQRMTDKPSDRWRGISVDSENNQFSLKTYELNSHIFSAISDRFICLLWYLIKKASCGRVIDNEALKTATSRRWESLFFFFWLTLNLGIYNISEYTCVPLGSDPKI